MLLSVVFGAVGIFATPESGVGGPIGMGAGAAIGIVAVGRAKTVEYEVRWKEIMVCVAIADDCPSLPQWRRIRNRIQSHSLPLALNDELCGIGAGAELQLLSTANSENGTTSFLYNADGSLYRKTDAKGQRVEYTYSAEGRVTATRRYAGTVEDTCARVDYHYGSQSFDASFTQNAAGRVAATATGCLGVRAGQLIEMYSYTAAGAVTKKRLRMVRSTGTVDKDVTYGYGADGKLATVLYPGASIPYAYTYDLMDRPTKMTGPSLLAGHVTINHAKDVVYGTAGQMTSMKYLQWQDGGNGAAHYFTESKSFNALYQMTRQTTTGTGGTAADIEYTFSPTANNGRITGRKNYVSGEDVVYSYDELNRLVNASIAGTGGWGQAFTYDGFGNLWSQAVTKNFRGLAPS